MSCGCCNRTPQTQWLRVTRVYSLPVLEVRGQSHWSRVSRAGFWRVQGRLCFLSLLRLLEAAHVPRLTAPSRPPAQHLQISSSSSASGATSPSLPPTLLPLACKDPCAYVGPTQIIQRSLPTSRSSVSHSVTHAKPPLSYKAAYSQVLRTRMWMSSGTLCIMRPPLTGRPDVHPCSWSQGSSGPSELTGAIVCCLARAGDLGCRRDPWRPSLPS